MYRKVKERNLNQQKSESFHKNRLNRQKKKIKIKKKGKYLEAFNASTSRRFLTICAVKRNIILLYFYKIIEL